MSRLPAFCQSCGSVFASPLVAKEPGRENAFEIPVPCPACEGSGRVPGELLDLSVEAARLFAEVEAPEADAFLKVLAEMSSGEEGPGDELILETARRAPAFVELARRLPAERSRVLAGVAGLLRRVRRETASAGRGSAGGDPDGAPAERDGSGGADGSDRAAAVHAAVRRLLDEEAVEPETSDVPDRVARARSRLEDAGRNDPCPCGSGDKYKDCHWVPDLRTTRT